FCRWRAHTEALSEDSGPEALSTQGQYFALQVFYKILKPVAGELSANCCRTITMTRYSAPVCGLSQRRQPPCRGGVEPASGGRTAESGPQEALSAEPTPPQAYRQHGTDVEHLRDRLFHQ